MASVRKCQGYACTSTALARICFIFRLDECWRTLEPDTICLVRPSAYPLPDTIVTISGHATLWMAVFADVGASLIVVFNGMRLLHKRFQEEIACPPLMEVW